MIPRHAPKPTKRRREPVVHVPAITLARYVVDPRSVREWVGEHLRRCKRCTARRVMYVELADRSDLPRLIKDLGEFPDRSFLSVA